ncbi:MAG TPA: hypothetical protein VHL09_04315 [Dehalococcoidia bacterium]|nr:hypothetical protein [Dehalococcoidia bacterium]
MKMKGKRPKRKTSVKLAPETRGHRHLAVVRLTAKPAGPKSPARRAQGTQ